MAAFHSGPGTALGSHPCVALSSSRPFDCTAFGGLDPLWPESDKSQGGAGDGVPRGGKRRISLLFGVRVMLTAHSRTCADERE